MRRAPLIACGILLAGIAALAWWVRRDPSPPATVVVAPALRTASPPPAEARSTPGRFVANERNSSRAEPTTEGTLIVPAIAESARQLHSSDTSAVHDLELLQSLIAFYRRANQGAGPSGSENEEIVAELRGKNSHRLAIFPPDLPGINDRGRLLDRWGTPYFFHAISRTVLEIRSAGPDRKLWTSDDITEGKGEP